MCLGYYALKNSYCSTFLSLFSFAVFFEFDILKVGCKVAGNIEKKNRRAASERISKITLPDLVKYFDIPIVEASRSLNVGLTVLKKKCREFGIPRWPHRKIKSLDSLIRDLQVLPMFITRPFCEY